MSFDTPAGCWLDRPCAPPYLFAPGRAQKFLRPYLARLRPGKQPTEFVVGEKAGGGPHGHSHLHKRAVGICKRAGVPTVCTHRLRGLHATLSLAGGASSDYVATALGHTSFGMTARHYVDPDALTAQRSAQVHDTLGMQRHHRAAEEFLRSLDPATLSQLLRLVAIPQGDS